MKQLIKKILPKNFLSYYHKSLAIAASVWYGRPSEKMIVIGVTGTNGKSSTVDFIARILEASGHKVGYTSTAMFKIADCEWLNDKKMTMLGRFALQGLLRQMVKAGCKYAVVETSSEGIKQFRNIGINYDVVVFTNLTPEHLESHGGFENYKKAKQQLFTNLISGKRKTISGKRIKKTIIANLDDEHAEDFLKFQAEEKIGFGLNEWIPDQVRDDNKGVKTIQASGIAYLPDGVSFMIDNLKFEAKVFGKFNIYNLLAAISVARSQNISLADCQKAVEKIHGVPGRMELVDEGQDFKVLVDYAPEPESLRQCYDTIKMHKMALSKIIHVLGSCGGGRDASRRPILGALSVDHADLSIITNEDPYDDDPVVIIDAVAQGAIDKGRILNESLYKVMDRREAIAKAFSLAKAGDLVLLTGKGCEQAICVANGKKIVWDERIVAREELKKLEK